MDVGKLANIIVEDCRLNLMAASQLVQPFVGKIPFRHTDYLAHLRGEKPASEMLQTVTRAFEGSQRLDLSIIFYLQNQSAESHTSLSSEQKIELTEVEQALEQAKLELEILFAQYGTGQNYTQ